MSDKIDPQALFAAIGALVSEVKGELISRIDSLDDNRVLKSASAAILSATTMAISSHTDAIMLKKATLLSGTRRDYFGDLL